VLCLGIGYAPPRPARQIDGHLLALVQAESMQCRSFPLVADAGDDPKCQALDDRSAVCGAPSGARYFPSSRPRPVNR